jgi:hypothetical protein
VSQHWFDRLAVSTAEGHGVSRRSVFKGAAAGAFAASALSSPRVARAAAHLEVRAARSDCKACVYSTAADEVKAVHKCVSTGGKSSSFLKKKSKKPKAPPIPSAQEINCVLRARLGFQQLISGCRAGNCKNAGLPPIDTSTPTPQNPGGSACPAGTTSCNGTQMCCYGGDLCCPCKESFICCVAAIGCTCCG